MTPAWMPTRDEVIKHLVLAAIVGAAAFAVHRVMKR